MGKRKYTKWGEEAKAYECTNRKCKWQGVDKDKADKKDGIWTHHVCPECENPEFYGLLEIPKNNLKN